MKITPELLTAYLDGELDEDQAEQVRERSRTDAQLASALAALEIDRGALARDYQALASEAPVADLRSVLAADMETLESARHFGGQPRLLMAVACAVCLAVGALVGSGNWVGNEKSWREAVAEYQVLYATETLQWNAVAPAEVDATLKRLSERIGVPLTRQALQVPFADFRRGQMLTFASHPLVQLAYLHDGAIPVAFCITRDGAPDAGPATEVREGLPIVHWAKNGTSYMVIGNVPSDQLARMAEALRGRL